LSDTKRCEVCGGIVKVLDDQSIFGYCENCGIVYALKEALKERGNVEPRRESVAELDNRSNDTGEGERDARVHTQEGPQAFSARWKCPDCGAEMNATSEGDLKFVIREHIREYHPNRST
jgi:predicted RNA-binding Zn-ribbon protein involved in translation (DUF1610 family)